MVEEEWLGGVSMNVGCIPSKSLLKNAEVAEILCDKGKRFGLSVDNQKIDISVAKGFRTMFTRIHHFRV